MEKNQLKSLLTDMSLSEKAGQLLQIHGRWFLEGGYEPSTGPALEFEITEEQAYSAGSVLNETGAANLKKLQDKIMSRQPHRIPALFMADVIHGYKTAFPVPIALGCGFDPGLIERISAAAAKEASAAGLHVTFAPMADLVRDPRWGRCMESTGEDPWLNARYAESAVNGFQGADLKEKGKIAACVKHFAAYGAAEAGRDYNSAEVSERTLFEDYLASYRAAVKAGAALAMTAFNAIGRIPCTANERLMRGILRGDMGFDGVLISDYNAIEETITHGVSVDKREAALKAIKAGCDIDMMSDCYIHNLERLVTDGIIPESLVDEAVMRVLELKNKLGLFENPYKGASAEDEHEFILCEEHKRLSREAAAECITLLKNGGMLPLPIKGKKIAVIGPLADSKEILGTWAIFADRGRVVTLRQALEELYPEAEISFAVSGGLDEAAGAAADADAVIILLGEDESFTGESRSRADISLPEGQKELFDAVYRANKKIITVLLGGRPLAIPETAEKSEAVIMAWLPGTYGMYSLADIIFGKINPSGKLSMSFPYCSGQLPMSYNALNTGRPKPKGDGFNLYFSNYLDVPNEPLYPFGHGLSYTEFEYSDIRLSSGVLTAGKPLTASVTVRNAGKTAGKESVLLYIRDLKASVARPIRELRGVKKVFIPAGGEAEVSFEITEETLRFYDINMEYKSEPGEFTVWIGDKDMNFSLRDD